MKALVLSLFLVSPLALADSSQQILQQKLAALKTFSAKFAQTVTDKQGEVLQQGKGQLQLQQPDKLRWQVQPPNENTLIADGKTLWHVDPFVEQVIAWDQASQVANNPIVLLAQPHSDAWQQYTITQQGQQFSVTAKSNTSQVAKLVFQFDGDKLVALDIVDRQQQLSHLQFSDIKQGIALDASLFQFSLPSGYNLDDQRDSAGT